MLHGVGGECGEVGLPLSACLGCCLTWMPEAERGQQEESLGPGHLATLLPSLSPGLESTTLLQLSELYLLECK